MHEVTLRMKQIKKSFSSVSVLKGVDLEARSGEVLALLGTNGAGKSTLMNILCGIFKQNSGEIELESYGSSRSRDCICSAGNDTYADYVYCR